MTPEEMRDAPMLELFRLEAEAQTQVLAAGLLLLERNPTLSDQLEACMRAAHSLKGAARIVGVEAGVRVAHAMEDCLVEAQEGRLFRPLAFTKTFTMAASSILAITLVPVLMTIVQFEALATVLWMLLALSALQSGRVVHCHRPFHLTAGTCAGSTTR